MVWWYPPMKVRLMLSTYSKMSSVFAPGYTEFVNFEQRDVK